MLVVVTWLAGTLLYHVLVMMFTIFASRKLLRILVGHTHTNVWRKKCHEFDEVKILKKSLTLLLLCSCDSIQMMILACNWPQILSNFQNMMLSISFHAFSSASKHTLWRHVLWSLDYFYLLGICTSYGYYISIQLLNVGVMGVVQCLLQVTKDMEPDSFFFSPWYCRFVGNDPSSASAVYSIASDCRLCFVFEFSIPLGLSDCRVSFVFEFSLPLGLSGCR